MSTSKSEHAHAPFRPIQEPPRTSTAVADTRVAAVQQQRLQVLASNSVQSKQLRACAHMLNHHAGTQQLKSVRLLVDGTEMQPSSYGATRSLPQGDALQLAKADVDYQIGNGGARHVTGTAVGQGAVGGQTHSEQLIWAQVSQPVLRALRDGRQVTLTFTVDTTICHLCSPWFENTVWGAMNAAATQGGGTFTLWADVLGHRVQIDAGRTVWPNEIADAPTWSRMDEFDKMDRFIREERDEDGEVGETHSPHVTSVLDDLKLAMESGGIAGDEIEACLEDAKDRGVAIQVAAYNYRDDMGNEDPAAMRAELDDIDLYTVISSGRIGHIANFEFNGGQAASQNRWKEQLTLLFFEWIETWISENLDEQRIQGDNPHIGP